MKNIFAATSLAILMITAPAFADHHEKSEKPKPVQHVKSDEALLILDKNKEIVVLDIRTEKEFGGGHIKGAKNIDFYGDNFGTEIGKLDRKKTYLVHCASGGRSGNSLKQFEKLEFVSIIHLDDGFKGWVKAGNPVEK